MKKVLLFLVVILSYGCNDPSKVTEAERGYWAREKFDEHIYVIRNGRGMTHDPDCPCGK